MTYLEIIELTDTREPNHYDTAQKLRWLEALEERVEKETGYILREEVIVKSEEVALSDAAEPRQLSQRESQGGKPLGGGAFEAEICVNYLIAQINAANGETERYNRSITLFNEMYAAFLSHLIRRSHGLKSNFSI